MATTVAQRGQGVTKAWDGATVGRGINGGGIVHLSDLTATVEAKQEGSSMATIPFQAQPSVMLDELGLRWRMYLLAQNSEPGQVTYVSSIETTSVPKAVAIEPDNIAVIEVSMEDMQALMERLWRMGLRPMSHIAHDNDKLVAAQRAHIADLQRVIFRD